MHDMQTSLVGALGFIVPGARHIADNMKESAGYFVRIRIKVGWFWTNYQKRVISFYVGNQVLVG